MQYLKKNWHIFFAIYIIVNIIFAILTISNQSQDNITTLNNEWTLTINNEIVSNNFNLTEDRFDMLKRGDVIEISRTLPELEYKNQTMELYSTYTTIETFVDDEKIYEFGLERYTKNLMLTDGLKWIEFNAHEGQTVKIKMIVTEDHAISHIREIKIGEELTLINNFIKQNIITIIISGFLLFLGFSLLMVFIKVRTIIEETKKIFFICLYTLLVGLWIVARDGILVLVLGDSASVKLIEYICLYSTCIPIFGFLMQLKDAKTNKELVNNKLLKYITIIHIIFNIVCILLHVLNIVHFKQTLQIFQLLLVVSTIIVIMNLFHSLRGNIQYDKLMMTGMLIMIGTIIIDVLAFNIKVIGFNIGKLFMNNTTTFGVTILLFVLIYSFYNELLNTIKKSSQMEMYNKLAFTDILTNLKNRAWYENYIKDLKDKNYTMISLDLNDLKITNDTSGHDKGDELITTFANILSESFDVNAHSIRFGGDEFLVILEYVDNDKMQKAINRMTEKIKTSNNNNNVHISVSYGIAYGTEKSLLSPIEVYKKADQRMYKMKKLMKLNKPR